MNRLQEAYEGMSQEDKDQFWLLLHKSMLWRKYLGIGRNTFSMCEKCICGMADFFWEKAKLGVEQYT